MEERLIQLVQAVFLNVIHLNYINALLEGSSLWGKVVISIFSILVGNALNLPQSGLPEQVPFYSGLPDFVLAIEVNLIGILGVVWEVLVVRVIILDAEMRRGILFHI